LVKGVTNYTENLFSIEFDGRGNFGKIYNYWNATRFSWMLLINDNKASLYYMKL
jgi:hypothetical protein